MKLKLAFLYFFISIFLFWMIDSISSIIYGISFLQALFLEHLVLRLLFVGFNLFGYFLLKRLEKKYNTNEKRYYELFNHTKNGVAIYKAINKGEDFIFVDFNKGGEKMESTKTNQLIGESVQKIFPEINSMGLLEIFKKVYKTGKPESFIGQYKDTWRDNYVYKLPSGEIVSIYSDITEIKQSEQNIKRNEQKLKVTFESIGDGVITTDKDLKITLINKAAEDILETNKENIIGHDIEDLFSADKITFGDSTIREIAFKVLNLGKISIIPKLKYKTPNGKEKMLEDSMSPIRSNGDMEGLVIVFRDITDKINIEEKSKKLEDQLLHSQKMETIGQFSGSIAHDFNNILTAISGSVDLAKINHSDLLCKKELSQIKRSVARATELTKKLLTFSRKQIINPQVVNINELIESSFDMISRLVGEDIEIEKQYNSTKNIKADISQLEQIILNLTANSRDALNEKNCSEKKISIRTYDYTPNSDEYDLPQNEYILIEVKDNGPGIPEEIRKKIFEPFFTTKKLGMGTGLGLATVYGIVKQNKGTIKINSFNNKGTTFKIYWPITNEIRKTQEKEKKKRISTKGTEIILLVEDNNDIRNITTEYLESLGYKIIQASNGKEALKIDLNEIDIVVTDLIMPEINGRELVNKIKEKIPTTKFLYTSGFTDTFNIDTENFIMKPYSLSDFAKKIRKVLEE